MKTNLEKLNAKRVSPNSSTFYDNSIAGRVCISDNDRWFCTEAAAAYLDMSLKALRNMTSNGKIPFYKLGKNNRYLKSELDKILLSNRRGGFDGI